MSTRPWIVTSHCLLPNGPAHRLVRALENQGKEVAFIGIPLLNAERSRSEKQFPRDPTPRDVIDIERHVSQREEIRSLWKLYSFAIKLKRMGITDPIVVACDPLVYLESMAVLYGINLRPQATAVWFVDWSAQRLQHYCSAVVYRALSRIAVSFSDIAASISPEAGFALQQASKYHESIVILPNLPLTFPNSPPWEERDRRILYTGGLSNQQGISLLVEAAKTLAEKGVQIDIAGDGPEREQVRNLARNMKGVRFHGIVEDHGALARLYGKARVGWALYDPSFPMNEYNDPLKIKDYLAAGMKVISSLDRTGTADSIEVIDYNSDKLVEASLRALVSSPTINPKDHIMLDNAFSALKSFIQLMERER